MDEILWFMKQQSRVLQDFREEIKPFWSDEAARTINSRYLDIHNKDESQMIIALNKQSELLNEVAKKIEFSREQTSKVEEYAETVLEKVNFAIQDLDTAHNNYDLYIQYNSDARAKFPQIEQLIKNANSACI